MNALEGSRFGLNDEYKHSENNRICGFLKGGDIIRVVYSKGIRCNFNPTRKLEEYYSAFKAVC